MRIKVFKIGTKIWYKNWYLNGQRHRDDGPACEYANGTKIWYLYDKRHRSDGPAIEYASGIKSWYVNGEKLTKVEFNTRMNPQSC